MTPSPTSFRNIIAKYVKSGQGRQIMASKMTPSLRRFRDYASVGRKAYLVEDLEDGALPIYDKDPIVPAYMIADDGDQVEAHVNSQRVVAPLFMIGACPYIHLTEIKERRFDMIKRTIELSVAGVKEKEDVRVFATMNALADDGSNPHADIPVAAPLSGAVVSDAYGVVEEHGLRVARAFVNGRDYADLRKLDRDVIDPETQQNLFKTGVIGKVYGAQMIKSRVVPLGTLYVCGEREYYGRIPVRLELTIVTADKPEWISVGFSMFEQLGILNYNFLSQQRILITR